MKNTIGNLCAAALVTAAISFGLTVQAKTCWPDPDKPGATSLVAAWNGREIRVDALADNLFRVRVKRGDVWTESGMNRYGVLTRAWPDAKPEWKTEKGFKTPSAEIAIDAAAKTVSFASAVSAAKFTAVPKLTEKGYELSIPLTETERIYGIGDVCRTNVMRRGLKYEVWVKNINSYIPIPMAISREGWGILMNTTWRNYFDVGCSRPDAMVLTAPESELDFYLFCGKDHAALLDIYTRLTGRPALLPAWGYGFTYVCNENIDMFNLVNDALRFRDLELPCDVLGLEPGWMNPHAKYDFSVLKKWDREKFEFGWAPAGRHTFIGALNRLDFKLSLWLCCNYDLFQYEEEVVAGRPFDFGSKVDVRQDPNDLFHDPRVEKGDGRTTLGTMDAEAIKRREAYIDKIKKGLEGPEPWFAHLRKFVQQGAQCFKLDGANQVTEHPNRAWLNGMTDEEAHNLYPLVYGKQMVQGFEAFTKKRAMVYSDGGYAGVQQFVATWAGDTGGGFKPLCSLLNLGLSGHANQSCDMGIFDVESLHFGFLQTWSQENSWAYWYQPWLQAKAGLATFRKYAQLRYRLIPYIYTTAAAASRTGFPVMRALALAYPDEPAYDQVANTYLLGPNLLCSAFTRTLTVPPGQWHEWRTGETITGPSTRPVPREKDWGGSLFVKAGAIVPMWPVRQSISAGWSNEVEFHVWPTADGTGELYEDDGLTLAYREGRYAQIPLSVKKTDKGAVFTIGRRHGSKKGVFVTPGKPDYQAVFHLEKAPTAATLDGQSVTGTWDAAAKTYTVTLGAVPVAGCRLELTF
ncbi:MAG: DUF5110 domain-containing protein [Kiritimatiellae bacterium]|nr:DUF5110 domain-containing protein [Kiritimatiellia bacterium]